MHPFFVIVGCYIPAYGFIIACGTLFALVLGYVVARHRHFDTNDYCALCGYGMFGGLIGAKVFYLFTRFQELDWTLLFDPVYSLSLVHTSGFVVIGGLIGGGLAISLGSRIHHLKANYLLQNLIFVLPLCQGFGRIACFMAGCCYGITYEGFGAVSFPHYSFAGAGYRFPVQLLSSGMLFFSAIVLYFISSTDYKRYSVYLYILIYTILRFFLEFLRGDDAERGVEGFLSPAQQLCVICFVGLVICLEYRLYFKRSRSKHE